MQKRIVLIAVCTFLFSAAGRGQYFLFDNEPPKIDLTFARHSLEAEPGKTIFNVVKVVNRSSQAQTFTLQLTAPAGWQIIGQDKFELTIPPLDSTLVPVRVAIGQKVRGDIGYSVIANVTDSRGSSIKTEYSFIKIPREVDLRVKVLTRYEYFDQQTGHAPIRVMVDNRGNREETVTINLEADSYLGIADARLQNYVQDVSIPPYTDSTLVFNVYLDRTVETSREVFRVNIRAQTLDTTFRGTSWLRNLSSSYSSYIPESRKMLIAEVFGKGLFSNYAKPTYSAIVQGNILLPKKREVNFFYNNYSTTPVENLYRYNRMWVGYKDGKLNVQLGDINKSIESSLYGRGGSVDVQLNRFKVEAVATQRVLNPLNNFGLKLDYSPSQSLGFEAGGTYSSALNENFDSRLGLAGVRFTLAKKYRFSLQMAYNQLEFGRTPDTLQSKTALGATANFTYSASQLRVSVRYKAGEKYFYSGYNGRSELMAQADYNFKNSSRLIYNAIDNRNSPGDYRTYGLTYQPYTNFHRQLLTYGVNFTPRFYLFTGPGFELNSTDIFPVIRRGEDYFSTIVYNYNAGLRFKGSRPGSSLTTQMFAGWVNVAHQPTHFQDPGFSIPDSKNKFDYQFFSINLRQPMWGAQAMYTNGPRSIYQQFSWYYSSRPTRLLRVMPYFDAFIYKDMLKLMVNVSYTNDLVSKSSYSNITSQLYWYLPRDWQIRLLNVYTIQSRTTGTETVERFQNMYFEASVRKEFGFQQPTVKYYDLKLVFFKDYNGNRIKNDNEPGIKNVLLSIQRTDTPEFPDFSSGELLSNQYGEVFFENIPAGIYDLSYNPVGTEAGTFSKADIESTIRFDKNTTLYIPFVEKNKVFGKIILNRSKLSGLGKVDVSNVRITVTDSRGNTFSTLTDKNGEFMIFAPITDEYIVSINNIFYEDFNLRQNNFRVQFNGYKQFEVNFVFDEKVRRINFSPSTQNLAEQGVLQVRRTNLRGTIKDESSLKPLRARVNLVNTLNNSIVASIYSNPQTGDFNLSFLAGDNYLLEILADDYWYYSETLNLNQVTTFMNVSRDILLKPIAIGSKIELNIRFEANRADLGPESVAELNRLLRILRDNPNIKVEIQGHTDDLEAISNSQVGEERAKAVARYLVENGFSNLQVRGFGNTVPVAPNDTEENRSLNRRVEVEVVERTTGQ